MEIFCPLVGVICLSIPALAYQLQFDNSGYVSFQLSRSFEPRGGRMRNQTFATKNNSEDLRFKEIKSMKRYSFPSFIPRKRIYHKSIELVPTTHFKNIQNESSQNIIGKSEEPSNQRRGSHHLDILRAIPRDRVDHRIQKKMVAPTIFKENAQNQTNEDHSIAKSKTTSNQRRSIHKSDILQAMPIAKQQKNYVPQFIDDQQGLLQSKTYEKPGYLAVNVHKAQVATVPLSLNVRWNFPTKIMNDQIQKVQETPGADKPMQGEEHSADNDRKTEGIAQGSSDKDITFREYAKREAQIDRNFKDPPSHGFSDSLKRYIIFKDKGPAKPKGPRVKGAIGIRSDNIEENIPIENPNAIFYKVHQSLEDGFILAPGGALGSLEHDSKSKLKNSKQSKQVGSANYETKNPNRVMKKFFNFNNGKYY